MAGNGGSARRRSTRCILGSALILAASCLVACSTPRADDPATRAAATPGAAKAAASAAASSRDRSSDVADADLIVRPHANWISVDWRDLPGWGSDRTAEVWLAFSRSCARAAPAWQATCAAARRTGFDAATRALPGNTAPTDAQVRAWLQQHLQPYRVESAEHQATGLATGYFEPLVEASRIRRGAFTHPLYGVPPDLATRKPYWTRREIDTLPAAQRSLRGHEIAWLRDPLDVLVLQVQGSGRLFFKQDGSTPRLVVRVAFAGHNDRPYQSVGRWLVEQGELRLEQASWPGIRGWAQRNPKRVDTLLHRNPRYVFFREEPLPDPELGPVGAQGVALVPGRSIAVDPLSIPYGTPVWLDTTAPLSSTPLQRLVVAQDTGTAINGAVRVDYFWGWGDDAEAQAGRMKQPLRIWALWPK